MRSIAPSSALAPFVRDLMISEAPDEVTRLRLPEPGFVMGVRYRGSASFVGEHDSVRLPEATLSGIAGSARRLRTSRGGAILLVRFHTGGAARIFDSPMHELAGTTIALDDVLPRTDVERLRIQVAEATDGGSRICAIESFLLARAKSRPAPDPVVGKALVAIRERGSELRIGSLARELGISHDALEKRFRRVVGTTPKQLASLLRLRRAIDAYRAGTPLTRLAVDAGYFDQSHFSRELRAVAGLTSMTPGHFFRAMEHR